MDGQIDRWMDGQKDGDLEKIALCRIIGHGPLQGRCPINFDSKPNQQMGQWVLRLLEDVMPFCMPPPPPFHPKENMEDTEKSSIKDMQSH